MLPTFQPNHATVHPAVKWIPANKDREAIVCG